MTLTQKLMAFAKKVGAVTLLLVLLKLCKVVAWGWWWVLSPIWFSWAVAALGAICLLVYLGLMRLGRP